jgi:hypothetical protein
MLGEQQPASAFLLKVYDDFKQTMVEINIWRTFAAIVFTHDTEQTPYGLLFDKEKSQQSGDFVELSERNKLSVECVKAMAKFKVWMN